MSEQETKQKILFWRSVDTKMAVILSKFTVLSLTSYFDVFF